MLSLVNVVWYDGVDSFVSKFVLETVNNQVTTSSRVKVENYLKGNGELLKLDVLYKVSLDNIVAFKGSDDDELQVAYQRFDTMYFD